jgi:hypothetical protein
MREGHWPDQWGQEGPIGGISTLCMVFRWTVRVITGSPMGTQIG